MLGTALIIVYLLMFFIALIPAVFVYYFLKGVIKIPNTCNSKDKETIETISVEEKYVNGEPIRTTTKTTYINIP